MPKRIGIQIHANDNVVTLVEDASPGDEVQYMTSQGARQIITADAVGLGHKIALRDIASGERIVKYDQPIGSASQSIQQGRHVHDHNVRSGVQGAQQ